MIVNIPASAKNCILDDASLADVAGGEASARQVTNPGSWEHPSWAADGRHVVASRDKAIFLVDTDLDADKPIQIFHNQGNWMNPACSR